MDEDTPWNPPSKKGQVRASIARQLLDAIAAGRIEGLIARSADFYGPGIKETSVLTETVINNLAKGKKAQWMGNPKLRHSFTYTPDTGKATALLGNSDRAYGQTWHLPTARPAPTGREWVNMFAEALQVKPRVQPISKAMLHLLGVFMPVIRELAEMHYQYTSNYEFSSKKIESAFGLRPTDYYTGIQEIVKQDFDRTGS